jgi:hypothetical protein
MDEQQARFEGWAVLEIFGHQRYAGYVTTEAYGQAVMFRIDVPPLEERERITRSYEWIDDRNVPPGSTVKEAAVPGYTKLFGVGAIYGITPCTQDAAVKAVAAMQPRKLQLISLGQERALGKAPTDEPIEDEDLARLHGAGESEEADDIDL